MGATRRTDQERCGGYPSEDPILIDQGARLKERGEKFGIGSPWVSHDSGTFAVRYIKDRQMAGFND
jgi:hypothetical protein